MGINMYIKYEWKTCIKIYWLNHIGKYLYYTRKNSYIKIVNIYYRDNIFFSVNALFKFNYFYYNLKI